MSLHILSSNVKRMEKVERGVVLSSNVKRMGKVERGVT
jgi:hypothetical protein